MGSRERALGCCSRCCHGPRSPDRRGHPATHLLCLVCRGNEDDERGQLGRADDLEGLFREGCSYQSVALPWAGSKHSQLAAVPQPHAVPSQAGTVPVRQWGLKETPLAGDMSSLGGLLEKGPCKPIPTAAWPWPCCHSQVCAVTGNTLTVPMSWEWKYHPRACWLCRLGREDRDSYSQHSGSSVFGSLCPPTPSPAPYLGLDVQNSDFVLLVDLVHCFKLGAKHVSLVASKLQELIG